ncbi:hypothetical protein M758_UG137000, partial [Ceratodon purpureus]
MHGPQQFHLDNALSIVSYIRKYPSLGLWFPQGEENKLESEYRALAKCSCEAIWLKRLIDELGFGTTEPIQLWCDNQSAIKIVKNPIFHDRTKHFETDWHFTRQKVEEKLLKVNFIQTTEQPADILTKASGRTKFENCRAKL